MDSTVRLAYGPWGETLAEYGDAAAAAEDAGFETVYSNELHRSATITAATMASRTRAIGVGTAIALAFVRSPMTTALEAMDLDDLSRGRLILGLGAGVRRLNEDWHNRPYGRPAPHMRETVEIIRRFIAVASTGADIDIEHEHEHMRLRNYQRPFPQPRDAIPVYLAAMGPGMVKLAGEIGDGWITHELGSARHLAATLPLLAEGVERAGRSRRDVTVVASACCVPHADRREARRRAAGLVAFYATVRSYDDFFAFHGELGAARELQEMFRAGHLTEMPARVPDTMIDALTVAGTPDDVRHAIDAYEGLADVVKLTPPTHFVDPDVTREAQRAILEMFAR